MGGLLRGKLRQTIVTVSAYKDLLLCQRESIIPLDVQSFDNQLQLNTKICHMSLETRQDFSFLKASQKQVITRKNIVTQ